MNKLTMRFVSVAVLMLALFLCMFSAAAYDAPDVNVDCGGVELKFRFDNVSKTAQLRGFVDPPGPTAVNVPSAITHDGETYTVDSVSMSGYSRITNVTALTLPDSVKEISGSFGILKSITGFTVPGSVKNFSAQFNGCTSLEKLVFSEGVETISSSMLVNDCTSLTEISLPSTLRSITNTGVFAGATALKSISLPEGVELNPDSAFSGCAALESVELPSNLNRIGSAMFEGCTSLKTVTGGGTLTDIGANAFDGCTALVSIPSLDAVTSVDRYAFNECQNLHASIDLTKLESVGMYAFNQCYYFTGGLDLSSFDTIPDYAFAYFGYFSGGTGELKLSDDLNSIGDGALMFITTTNDLVLPEGLKNIGSYAFYSSKLGSGKLTLPDSLASLGASAFEGTQFTELHIGSGLESIPAEAFAGMPLTSVTIDASKEDITIASDAFPDNVTPVYTVPSVEDNETVDGETSIHDAVKTSGTVVLKKDIKLTSPIVIESGVSVTLRSDEPHIITADSSKSLPCLIEVEEGGSLTLEGALTLNGRYVSVQYQGGVVICAGELELKEGAAIEGARFAAQEGGTVRVTGRFTMSGGEISGNSYTGPYVSSSSGVLVASGGKFELTGGSISGNSGFLGSGVMVMSGDPEVRASFVMRGGEISGNSSAPGVSSEAAGAVFVYGYSDFDMYGGDIRGNTVKGGPGGGVCVLDPGVKYSDGTPQNTSFTMYGGRICNNSSTNAGGGIYSFSDSVLLLCGEISGNRSNTLGGGVYSEGNTTGYSTIHMANVLVTGNSASNQGGGLWLCPTGMGEVYATGGAAILNNRAEGAGDDVIISGAGGGAGHYLSLADRLPGGGSVSWYKDGATYGEALPGQWPAVDPSVPRFDTADPGEALSIVGEDSIALKARMTTGAEAAARAQAKLLITGNSAEMGGGIAANGGVVIGENRDTQEISVKKVWQGVGQESPVTVRIFADGHEIDSLVLSRANDWEGTITGLPADLGEISAEEQPLKGSTADIDIQRTASGWAVTVTNTFSPATPRPEQPPEETKPGLPGDLNTVDHFGYLIGYEDGSVRPDGGITRAETATIFFRLLTDEAREAYWCETNPYSDVNAGDWFNNAVSTLSNMGILGGYEDGSFRPNAGITRAEFAKIAVSFFELGEVSGGSSFADVVPGAWYASYVSAAVQLGLVEGYEGGVFRPEAGITRAEAATIINRTLGRDPVKEGLLPRSEMNIWPDNPENAWFYAQMQEATNSHEYTRAASGEFWTKKLPERDWDALEY